MEAAWKLLCARLETRDYFTKSLVSTDSLDVASDLFVRREISEGERLIIDTVQETIRRRDDDAYF